MVALAMSYVVLCYVTLQDSSRPGDPVTVMMIFVGGIKDDRIITPARLL